MPRQAFAHLATNVPLHGLSAFGDLKYPESAQVFDYASPDVPMGGTFSFQPTSWYWNQSTQTFNTLNTFTLRGDAPPRVEMCFASLMSGALDEPDAIYGLIAKSVMVSEDLNQFTFTLRPEAEFHDGTPITAQDIAFTYLLLKEKGHPDFALSLANLISAEALGEREMRLNFDGKQSARAILSCAAFPILSKADIDANGFETRGLKPLLGSGPYKVGTVSADRSIAYMRIHDHWTDQVAVARGMNHFDQIRIEFYRDRLAAFEAFKKGELHYREEYTSRVWATGYDFPAVRDKRVVLKEFPAELRPSMQAWALNQRRERFRDPRTREAISLCFDFEWTNRNLFFEAYTRAQSTFEKSPFRAEGMPSAEELALLEPYRDDLPEAAFGEAVIQPATDGSGRDRKNLGHAAKLLKDVGMVRQGDALYTASGERMVVEILLYDEGLARVCSGFVDNMRAIGLDASIRLVDPTQYQVRQTDFDFDMISQATSFTPTPTRDDMLSFFHSKTVNMKGSRNLPGTANPAIDALIEAIGTAETHQELTFAMRALDRALRARRDWIPTYFSSTHRSAFWDLFSYKEPKPDYAFPVESLWWIDKTKAGDSN